MFTLPATNKILDVGFGTIVESYEVIHFDQVPILFTGINKFGYRIIGSFVAEDNKGEFHRYFNALISSDTYNAFVHGKITYRKILEQFKNVIVVDQDIEDKEKKQVYLIPIENIPPEYLPSETTFYPLLNKKKSLNYSVSLVGGLADLHRADPSDVSKIQKSFTKALAHSCSPIRNALDSRILMQPSMAGSYKMNFDIELIEKGQMLFDADKDSFAEFVALFFDYCINSVNGEIRLILDDRGHPREFKRVMDHYAGLKKALAYNEERDDRKDLLLFMKDCLEQLSKISEAAYSPNFKTIEFYNLDGDRRNVVGVIDRNFKYASLPTIEMIEDAIEGAVIDAVPQNYEIIIYNLNVQTRSGNASVAKFEKPNQFCRPRIKFTGTKPLQGSPYSKSLHENEKIVVRGIGRRINDVYRSIKIDY